MTGDPSLPLISVVIPAYNAQDTIAQTLRSVQAQTYSALEIIVVDDGSRDDTARIVEQFAADDQRIRLVRQENAGVARARNNGWHQARSDIIAFVDADDLWTQDKIACQYAALQAAGPRAGLVYSWYVMIDDGNRVTYRGEGPTFAGAVLDTLLINNFIGNGSAVLARREAIAAANGYEPALFDASAQGCEDILFYCRVAEHYEFAVVEDYQIGYRQLPNAMSANLPRMLRSWIMVLDEMKAKHPEKKGLIRKGLRAYANWTARRAVHRRQIGVVFQLAAIAAARSPAVALGMILGTAPATAFEALRWRIPVGRKASNSQAASAAAESTPSRFSVGSIFEG
ncbi:glycosyltransferase family 2 protein [Novosphingobium album (ex Hu et al. 2023)]|uniref:Glycosyltransferase family 2 protein n=1 Tax=Novosphingobium album (ex Hu et al. 2023) TaxID=2930093 RepID=A0ABT0B4V7_9SPHN|nr:glycosyltransferase family 2 protein [Novosphingobium album (ex Hu et al. 2023)]MCJ2180071.1 glycosyltransferase family 2 protein [Novosphingobium album (ex Hu et al. 2023)]